MLNESCFSWRCNEWSKVNRQTVTDCGRNKAEAQYEMLVRAKLLSGIYLFPMIWGYAVMVYHPTGGEQP